jgi:hypothetical protein
MDKYLVNGANGYQDEALPLTASTGNITADGGRIIGTDPATGLVPESLIPGRDVIVLVASEALTAGDYVNVWDNAGVPSVRLADASAPGKHATGYVQQGYATGANAEVWSEGRNNQVTGRTPGATQFLDPANPGKAIETRPTTAGQVLQVLGTAYTPTSMSFEWQPPSTLA